MIQLWLAISDGIWNMTWVYRGYKGVMLAMYPRNLQQDPLNDTEWTPKPEYLIDLATYLGVRW